MNIAERLKLLREKHGYSQQFVADSLKINRTTYVKYESGASNPTRKLQEIASFYDVTVDYLLGRTDITSLPGYIGPVVENKKIPIIGSVRCGPNGLAFQYIDEFVTIDESFTGNIIAFRCKGDSMIDLGISDGDIAIVRQQEDVESGEVAVVVINGDEGTLKRVRKFEGGIILLPANPAYKERVFTGDELNNIRIVGKVLEIRKRL